MLYKHVDAALLSAHRKMPQLYDPLQLRVKHVQQSVAQEKISTVKENAIPWLWAYVHFYQPSHHARIFLLIWIMPCHYAPKKISFGSSLSIRYPSHHWSRVTVLDWAAMAYLCHFSISYAKIHLSSVR